MEFIDEKLSKYAEKHTTPENELIKSLNRDTHANVLAPRMLSGHLQGRLLSLFSKMIQPKAILEIGTYTGYAALCLVEGLTKDGILHTIDINEELETRIQKYFNQSTYKNQIKLHIGNALEIIPTINQKFDLVFIDADKENYSKYYDLLIDQMPSGGIIMADNVLWSGKVINQEAISTDNDTRELDHFNAKVQSDPRVENILIPVRDGIMVARKY
ncbi:MAG: O-methyltransferase [Bacteroidia bacterium]|nr:O-methyltransferase [Bacteroidia bacterium]|tara:strand:+ start:4120 stop:4764 length:645 start_codon:yes stop_codon:yes gene_type:complete